MANFTFADFREDDKAIIEGIESLLRQSPSQLATLGYWAMLDALAERYYFAGAKYGWLRHAGNAPHKA